MKDIIDSIKAQIKERKAELAKLESALSKLEGDKPAPKAKAANGAASTKSGSARNTTDGTAAGAPATGPLPDRIIELLKKEATQTDSGCMSADAISTRLKADIGQVRTTCSRLARDGRVAVSKIGRNSSYYVKKEEGGTETTTGDVNPFTAEDAN
jgi:cell division septum initiation protein DivIVA